MSQDSTKSAVQSTDNSGPEIDALLEELWQAQVEMERLSERAVKLLGRPKELPEGRDEK